MCQSKIHTLSDFYHQLILGISFALKTKKAEKSSFMFQNHTICLEQLVYKKENENNVSQRNYDGKSCLLHSGY